MRLKLLAACSLALFSTGAGAQPLEFSGITRETEARTSPEVSCPIPDVCRLARSSFAGVPIDYSSVSVDRQTGRVRSIVLSFHTLYVDTALSALTTKYGEPASSVAKEMTNRTGGPYTAKVYRWPIFDNGEGLLLTSGEDDATLLISLTDTRAPIDEPKVDF